MGFIFCDEEEEEMRGDGPRPLFEAVEQAIGLTAQNWLGEHAGERFADPVFGRMPYREYLWTEEWRARRRRVLDRAQGRCQGCGIVGQMLDVHHMTYIRRGCEAEGDLLALCRPCHDREHREGGSEP